MVDISLNVNRLTPTVAIMGSAIKHPVPDRFIKVGSRRHLYNDIRAR